MFEHIVEGCQCAGKICSKCGETKCHSDISNIQPLCFCRNNRKMTRVIDYRKDNPNG